MRLASTDARQSSSLTSSDRRRAGRVAACVGDQDVDRPEFMLDVAAHGLDAGEAGGDVDRGDPGGSAAWLTRTW